MGKLSTYRAAVTYDPVAFGRRVASARAWIGLKPKELAKRISRSPEAINRIERGEHLTEPDPLMLGALAAELGQSEEWLLGGEEPPWLSSNEGNEIAELRDQLETEVARLRRAVDGIEQHVAGDAEPAQRGRRQGGRG
jgi:transcriptional regulator with XRE-family HTH domain